MPYCLFSLCTSAFLNSKVYPMLTWNAPDCLLIDCISDLVLQGGSSRNVHIHAIKPCGGEMYSFMWF